MDTRSSFLNIPPRTEWEVLTDHKLYTAEGYTQNANIYMSQCLCYYGTQFRFTIVNNTRHTVRFEDSRVTIDRWNGSN